MAWGLLNNNVHADRNWEECRLAPGPESADVTYDSSKTDFRHESTIGGP